jgi:endonuclease YncB( thermonuclease family)
MHSHGLDARGTCELPLDRWTRHRPLRWLLLIFLLVVGSFGTKPAHSEDIAGQASVIDGDTLEIHGQRIRLAGIDAPESRQTCIKSTGEVYRCGQVAAIALADKLVGSVVRCTGGLHDRYRRLIAVCVALGIDLNSWMVAQGLAVAYRQYSISYVSQEEIARQQHIGIWSGTFEMPWDWRRRH